MLVAAGGAAQLLSSSSGVPLALPVLDRVCTARLATAAPGPFCQHEVACRVIARSRKQPCSPLRTLGKMAQNSYLLIDGYRAPKAVYPLHHWQSQWHTEDCPQSRFPSPQHQPHRNEYSGFTSMALMAGRRPPMAPMARATVMPVARMSPLTTMSRATNLPPPPPPPMMLFTS